MQLLYGERVLAQVAFASRCHCVVRHEHRLSWAYRSATASTVMFSWWSELSGSSCQLLPSPLRNHTHNKQIFTSPTTGFFFPLIYQRVSDTISPQDDLWPLFWHLNEGLNISSAIQVFFSIDGICCTGRCDLWWHPVGHYQVEWDGLTM